MDQFRTGKSYTLAQAARLANTSPQNVRRWLAGYSAGARHMEPVFGRGAEERSVSFLQLAELIVVATFRRPDASGRRTVTLEQLRRAHKYARDVFDLGYPFASLDLKREGGHVLHDFDVQDPAAGHLALDLGGQWVLPFGVQDELASFDFDASDRLAVRWFPPAGGRRIVVDPHISAGRPTIVDRRVTTTALYNRFRAGETIEIIAEDFSLSQSDVEAALRYAQAAA